MEKKIFIIDDDPGISETVRIFLEEEGYKTKWYSDGSRIEKILEKEKPDLLVIDYMLPGRNGDEITRAIRGKLNLRNLPIIMIAANQTSKKLAKASGVNEFLDKPFNMYELLNLVKRYTK